MSDTVMTIDDFAAHLPELVEQIHARGDAAVIVRDGRPVVRIVPIPATDEGPEDLAAFSRRWRSEDSQPDEQLAEDIEASRRAVQGPRDPWD